MSITVPLPETYWDGIAKGVNFSLAGTGGRDCVEFIPFNQKIWETCLALTISFTFCGFSYSRLRLNVPSTNYTQAHYSPFSQALLVLLCLTFGCEIGYKLSTSTVIWLANPCHILTMTQIVLLAAPPRRWVTVLFRIMVHSMHGAVVALLLPVTNTRLLPFEVVVYWVQHILIVSIPMFLISRGGPYVPEPILAMEWPVMALGILYFIYWIPVQFLGILTEVNLNNMICPAISDPFYGIYYRLWALLHCAICILFFGKLYTWVSLKVLYFMGIDPSKINEHAVEHMNGQVKND